MSDSGVTSSGMTFEQIKSIIPQRFPFLMLDRVIEIQPGIRIVGVKNLSGNEWFYQGHFPNRAITPGAMICEGVAQTGIIYFHLARTERSNATYLLSSLKMRFLRPVTPGDQLHFEVTPIKLVQGRAILHAEVTVEGSLVAKGEFSLALKAFEDQ